MTNIVNIWSNYVTDLLTKVQKNGVNKYGTKSWYSMASLEIVEYWELLGIVHQLQIDLKS